MMNKAPKISIVVPFINLDAYAEECIQYCQALNYSNFEIILLPDQEIQNRYGDVKIIPTGQIKPALKRNIGIKASGGEIIALIDADAFPHKDWLKHAVPHFSNAEVGAVGGPNLTPDSDSFQQQVYGNVLFSRLCLNSFATGMFRGNSNRECDELPSCNLLIRRSLFFGEVGFFNPALLTAEDSLLCNKIRDAGNKIIYDENAIVYHHRRGSLKAFIKQSWIFGRDRALQMRNYFDWRMLSHALPSFFVLSILVGGILAGINTHIKWFYGACIAIYLIIVGCESLTHRPFKMIIPVFLGIIATHLSYGIGFLRGLVKENCMRNQGQNHAL